MTGSARDFGRDLYPFLYEAPQSDAARLDLVLADVRTSTLQKCRDVVALRRQIVEEWGDLLVLAAGAMADAFAGGRKLLAFGNGGSATDAADVAADCLAPPFAHWRALPAIALTNDIAVVTAVANDVGFENVFSRQVIALGSAGDMALGISTSGNSRNVVAGLVEARRRGLLTVVLTGNDGGAMARPGVADFCFVVRTEYIPRIQEGQATLWHALLELVQEQLARRSADASVAAD